MERQSLHLLVVENDLLTRKALRQGFSETGAKCVLATRGNHGLELALTQQFDSIILDVMLPDKNGLEILRELRERGIQTPVLLLTALSKVEERVAGLTAGADDCLVKPFSFIELLARVQAICRRTRTRPAPVMQTGDLALDLATRRASHDGKAIHLTPIEFRLLEFLMRQAGRVVTRKALCEHLWNSCWECSANVIDVHMARLRSKLKRGQADAFIQTRRGCGFTLRL